MPIDSALQAVPLPADDDQPAEIAALLAAYRSLKVQAAVLENEMKAIRDRVYPIVERDGKWQDDLGYAKLIERQPQVVFDYGQVENLMKAWLDSDDSIMASCGRMLSNAQGVKAGYVYLQLK